jgi:heat shock protein HtpX
VKVNTLKTFSLMGFLTILLVFLGNAFFGQTGATIFFVIAMGMNLFSYFYSDKMAIKMTRSYPVSRQEAPEFYALVENLVKRADLPMPKLYITPSEQPNAFATGRNPQHAAVAVTEGLLRLMNRAELEGVLAHELAHVKNRDILISTIAAGLAGAISMMGNALQWGMIFGMGRGDDEEGGGMLGGLLMAIVAPIAAMIVQMAISRSREYAADATGAQIAGSADGLANALEKLQMASQRIPMQVNPATSHMFIMNPLSGASVARLFSTHPSTEERVARLRAMHR